MDSLRGQPNPESRVRAEHIDRSIWLFTVLRTERKMGRRFAKVSEEKIVAINEAAFFIHLIW